MSEKFVAGLVTAAVVAPLCAVCILGPAMLASVLAGTMGWIGGFDPVVTIALILVAGFAVYGIVRRRKANRYQTVRSIEVRDER